ncbi:MAG: hypothetical protein WC721_15355 [Victivallaceae bacterium]
MDGESSAKLKNILFNDSPISELVVQNVFVLVPSVPGLVCPKYGKEVSGMFVKLKNSTPKYRSAGGCPVCYAGRMGWAGRRIQNE